VVLLTPFALERCRESRRLARREIEAALDSNRNIVLLMLEGFDFAIPSVSKLLTGKLAELRRYDALTIPPAYFSKRWSGCGIKYLNV
jgi:hypothetical protein